MEREEEERKMKVFDVETGSHLHRMKFHFPFLYLTFLATIHSHKVGKFLSASKESVS